MNDLDFEMDLCTGRVCGWMVHELGYTAPRNVLSIGLNLAVLGGRVGDSISFPSASGARTPDMAAG